MSKKLLKYFSFSLFFLLIACAPKVAPPPLYQDSSLSLDEIISISRSDINSLKAIVGINIEKDNNPYSFISASLILKKPNWLQMRWYKFGLLAGDLFIKDNVVQTVSGKGADTFKTFGSELYSTVLWWEDLGKASMHREGKEYFIRTKSREIRLDAATLLPKQQEISVKGRKVLIRYEKPKQLSSETLQKGPRDNYWYPSEVIIETGVYRFRVTIDKLFINPSLEGPDLAT
ncbi:hypothetical protein EP227_02980 [bacterium]|nr:MAG: hypothetical protein EP227_02980 [bacterium]